MLNDLPKFVFLTGKGGVGKTSLACATAASLANAGKRVLLVSTDPTSDAGEVFGVAIGNKISQIAAVPGLEALEIDPEAAANYRERIVGPIRGVLPEKALKGIAEQLSGAWATEIAAFDEFTVLLTDDAVTGTYDHIIFDTAPTGHTRRLLKLPGAWSGFLATGRDASCLGPLAGLEKQRAPRRGGGTGGVRARGGSDHHRPRRASDRDADGRRAAPDRQPDRPRGRDDRLPRPHPCDQGCQP